MRDAGWEHVKKMSGAAAMFALLASLLLLNACTGVPQGVEPVRGFAVDRYTGTWYEIARFDHSFERGLTNVRADYALRKDGGIDVTNSGFDPGKKVWKKARGRGYFIGDPDVGQLKVSFFGPFYGAYNVIALDRDYAWAIVCGNTRNYLWVLARTPKLEAPVMTALIEKAKSMGFDTEKLIIVQHEPP